MRKVFKRKWTTLVLILLFFMGNVMIPAVALAEGPHQAFTESLSDSMNDETTDTPSVDYLEKQLAEESFEGKEDEGTGTASNGLTESKDAESAHLDEDRDGERHVETPPIQNTPTEDAVQDKEITVKEVEPIAPENDEQQASETDNTEDSQQDISKVGEDDKEQTDVSQEQTDDQPKKIPPASVSQGIQENIIDALNLYRADGTPYREDELLEPDEDLKLALDWSLPNGHEYRSGDTFTFQLPEQLAIYNELTGHLDNYGSYVVTTEGHATFTFNENIESRSNVKGTFWIDTALSEIEIKTSTEVLEFIFNGETVDRLPIQIKPYNGQGIHKEGYPIDGNFNTEEIEWTVIINTTRDTLVDAVVTDNMPEGLILLLGSIVIKEVEVDLQGNVIAEKGIASNYTDASTEEKLTLELGDTNEAYQLTFRTKMKETEKDKEGTTLYRNTAFLNSEGLGEKQSSASVSVKRPESLTKNASNYDQTDRSVAWTVNANFTEKQLSAGDAITDEFTFTVGAEEISDVFEVIEIEIDQVDRFGADGNVEATSDATHLFDILITGQKVTYTLKEDSSKAFILKYKTKVKEDAYITHDGTIANTVQLDGKQVTKRTGIVQQVGTKSHGGIDYENQTISWTITINADEQDLRNFVLTDDFSESGQKLVPGSINVDPQINDAQIIPAEEGFEIRFGDITSQYTITYQTTYTYDFNGAKTPNFKNGVHLSYETSDGKPYSLEFDREVIPNSETKNNGVKNGKVNNETKEITWTVDVNYNQLELMNARLIDEIDDNQSLVVGSVKVYETTIARNGHIQVGKDVTEQFQDDITTTENLVEVTFGAIDQSYRVEFITVDKDGIYNAGEVYENTAQFIPRENEVHDLYANVTLPNQGAFIDKKGLHNRTDWTVDWTVDVNASKSQLTDVTVTDDLGSTDFHILLEDSIEVTQVDSTEVLVEGEDYELTVEGNTLTVHFPGVITEAYKITYVSYIVAEETTNITNEVAVDSVEVVQGSIEKIETVQVRISTGGGTGEGVTGELILEKIETETERPLENVAFSLSKRVGNQEIIVREGVTDEKGELHWTGLQYGEYMLTEVIPEGYLGEETQEITLSSDAPEGIQRITLENERQTGTVKIIKVDAVTKDRLAGATFRLVQVATGHEYLLTTKEDGIIEAEVAFGEYSVEEISAPHGYRVNPTMDPIIIEIDELTEIEVQNDAIVEVMVEKTWIDRNADHRPASITVKLLANGQEIAEQQVTEVSDWTYRFTNLDKYDEHGEVIDYSIEEVSVDGYDTYQDGYHLINVETVAMSGEKTWVEIDDRYRPDAIEVHLLANGEATGQTVEVRPNEVGKWLYTFTDLPMFDLDGETIAYTVEERDVIGYESFVDGMNVTNTQVTTELTGTKTWKDDGSIEERPDSIIVRVITGDMVVQEQRVSPDADGAWHYTFTDLPKYDKNGQEIYYTVEEEPIDGYETIVDDHNLTNVRVGTTTIEINKLWKDENPADRPESIQINLLQNGEYYETYEVTEEKDWNLQIVDLPKYDAEGKVYTYTIKEHDVPGYAATIDGFEVTNIRSEQKDIVITKTWLDHEDSAARPDGIFVQLYRSVSGETKEYVDTYQLTEEDNWSIKVENLPAFDAHGRAYAYEIIESPVDGYETMINGFDIVNLRVGTVEVTGTKTWLDDQSPERPERITVNLLQNGAVITSKEVTEETGWTYAFTDLDEFDEAGVPYIYTVQEEQITGYNTMIDGYDLTNVRVGTTDVSGTKTWKDDDPADRPDSITVNLLQNGIVIDTVVVTAADDWSYAFTDLDQYDELGVAYDYAIHEQEVPGYQSEVDGYDLINTRSEIISITVTKAWLDDDAEERPNQITVHLLQNDVIIDTVEISSADDWTYEFIDLPGYDENGFAYKYTIEEEHVSGYETIIHGYDITNVRVGMMDVSGTKTWKDDDPADRPDSITVILRANGEIIEQIDVTAETDWTYSFGERPAYDAEGKVIDYTIEEVAVPGYETEIDRFDITNTLIERDEPEEPGKGDDREDKEDPTESTDNEHELPKTATNIYSMLFIGVILLGSGGMLWFLIGRKRKKYGL